MRSPEELRADILAAVRPMPVIESALPDADGCVLAEDVVSPLSLPAFDNSAMDGYAVRAADVREATEQEPVRLAVLGDIAAGQVAARSITAGTTMRIMTGAPVPAGADAIVRVEDTDGGADSVLVRSAVAVGRDIRLTGDDVATGATVLEHGTLLGARQLGLLAAIGRVRVRVHRQPVIVIVPTGSELLAPGDEPRPGAIYDSNGPLLASAVRATGAHAVVHSAVSDDDAAFAAAIDAAATSGDLVITTGGVSMGVYDTAKAVLSRRGTVTFEKIAMNPGMPQGFGHVGEPPTPIITLPGNPVSAFVSFEAFVRPAIRAMQARRDVLRALRAATCTQAFTSPAGKVQFVRAIVDGHDALVVAPVGGQGSHIMGGLAAANSLIVIPAEQTSVAAGDTVHIFDLREDS